VVHRKDAALERRFQQVALISQRRRYRLDSAGTEERYEVHHGVKISDSGGSNAIGEVYQRSLLA